MGIVNLSIDGFKTKVHGLVRRKLDALGGAVAEEARRLAPVDTGFLKSQITHASDPGSLKVTIISGASYSIFCEFGTSRMAARPFLRPALAQAGRLWQSLGNTELAFPGTPEPYGLAPERTTGLGRANVTIRGSRPFGSHPRGAPLGRAT